VNKKEERERNFVDKNDLGDEWVIKCGKSPQEENLSPASKGHRAWRRVDSYPASLGS